MHGQEAGGVVNRKLTLGASIDVKMSGAGGFFIE
jgi:hypothetical protein